MQPPAPRVPVPTTSRDQQHKGAIKVAKKNSGGLFGALTVKQTEKLMDKLRDGAEALPDDYDSNLTAAEIYRVINDDLHPSYQVKRWGRVL